MPCCIKVSISKNTYMILNIFIVCLAFKYEHLNLHDKIYAYVFYVESLNISFYDR